MKFSALIAALLALSLSACGKQATAPAAAPAPAVEAASAVAAPAASAVAAPGAPTLTPGTAEPVKK